MNLFQILDLGFCKDEMLVLIGAIKTIFTLIQIAIPGFLIVLGTIDMFKAMTSGDEKKTKEAQKTFMRRLIYAVIAFLIPFIIRLVFSFVGRTINTDDPSAIGAYEEFFACWNGSKASSNTSNKNSSSSTCTCVYGGNKTTGIPRDRCTNPQYYNGTCED